MRMILINHLCLSRCFFWQCLAAVMHKPINTLRRASALGLALTCVSVSLSAEAIEPDAATNQELLPYVVVSAPRFINKDVEVASRVQLIDQAEIVDSGATDLVQLLSKEANVHFRSTSGNSSQSEISMGGFGEASGQRVLILLDGHRLNTADLGQINWLSIPLALIESVEVIKGGQSAVYGNNAVGGVIKVNTRRPTDELAGQVQVSGGSFDSYNSRFAVSGREGSLGFSVHAEHNETDGYRDNSQYEADSAGLKLDWVSTNWFNAYASISGVSSEYGLPGPLTRAELASDRHQSTEGDNNGEEDALYYRGGIGTCAGDLWTLALDGGFTDRDIRSEFFYASPSYPYYYLEQEYEIFSISPTLTYEDGQVTAVLGIDYYDDQVDATSIDLYGVYPYEYSRKTLAAFTSFSWNINEDWEMSASLRIEDAKTEAETSAGIGSDEVDDDEYAWSLGLVHFIGDSSRAYASVRRFYRYPATDEVIDVFSGPIPVINFNLDPEAGHEVELGGDTVCGDLTLGGRVYYQWMEDEIIYDSSIGMFGANVNVDETRRVGVDLLASYAISENIDASLNYMWVQAEIADGPYDGSDVPLVPEHKVRLQVEYRPSDVMRIGAGATYTHDVHVGGDFGNTASELRDYVLFDLSVRYALSDDVSVFVTVDNLFDKEYVSTAFGPDGLYPGVGRSAKAGVTLSF